MTEQHELGAMAKAIIDSGSYMVIGTADDSGLPWVSPVWFAPEDYREFFWVSSPEARHSRNIATRPQVAIVIFDSHVPPGSGQGVWMAAVAEELSDDDLERGISIFARRSEEQALRVWTREDVVPPASHRIYRATASDISCSGRVTSGCR